MSFPQPGPELAKSVISMSIEIVKVADAVSTEKGTSHGSMKSKHASSSENAVNLIPGKKHTSITRLLNN